MIILILWPESHVLRVNLSKLILFYCIMSLSFHDIDHEFDKLN
jgi:hypothetical protein